jgi:hypothetical protein
MILDLREIVQICAIECITKNILMKCFQTAIFTFLLLPWLVTFMANFKVNKNKNKSRIRGVLYSGVK